MWNRWRLLRELQDAPRAHANRPEQAAHLRGQVMELSMVLVEVPSEQGQRPAEYRRGERPLEHPS